MGALQMTQASSLLCLCCRSAAKCCHCGCSVNAARCFCYCFQCSFSGPLLQAVTPSFQQADPNAQQQEQGATRGGTAFQQQVGCFPPNAACNVVPFQGHPNNDLLCTGKCSNIGLVYNPSWCYRVAGGRRWGWRWHRRWGWRQHKCNRLDAGGSRWVKSCRRPSVTRRVPPYS